MSRTFFPPKLVGEVSSLMFDFVSLLAPGEGLVSAVVTYEAYIGVASGPTMISGSPAISQTKVLQLITGGVAGNIYVFSCNATTSFNNILLLEGYVSVSNGSAAPGPSPTPTPAPPAPVGTSYYTQLEGGADPWVYADGGIAAKSNKLAVAVTEASGTPSFGLLYLDTSGAVLWKKQCHANSNAALTILSLDSLISDGSTGFDVLLNATKAGKGVMLYQHYTSAGAVDKEWILELPGNSLATTGARPSLQRVSSTLLICAIYDTTVGEHLLVALNPSTRAIAWQKRFDLGVLTFRTIASILVINSDLYLFLVEVNAVPLTFDLVIKYNATTGVQTWARYITYTGGFTTGATWLVQRGMNLQLMGRSGSAPVTLVGVQILATTGDVGVGSLFEAFVGGVVTDLTFSCPPVTDGSFIYVGTVYAQGLLSDWPLFVAITLDTNDFVWGNVLDLTTWTPKVSLPLATAVSNGFIYFQGSGVGPLVAAPSDGAKTGSVLNFPEGNAPYSEYTTNLRRTDVSGSMFSSAAVAASIPGDALCSTIATTTMSTISEAIINPSPPTSF